MQMKEKQERGPVSLDSCKCTRSLACSLDLGQNQRNLSPGYLLRKQMIPLKCSLNDVHASAAKAVVQPSLRNLNRRRGRRRPYHRLTLVQR
jgi:hypothetical protein